MSAGNRLLIFPVPRIFILLVFIICNTSNGDARNRAPSCPPSSCGNLTEIKFPFRLKTDPRSCGHNNTYFELDCENNRTTVLTIGTSRRYYVQTIDYTEFRVRVVDPGINRRNLFSCPVNEFLSYSDSGFLFAANVMMYVAFIHCLSPVNSAKYVKGPFCGNTSNLFANSSEFYSYVTVEDHDLFMSELEESCMVNRIAYISTRLPMMDRSSLGSIYDGLAYGFELYYWDIHKRCYHYNYFDMLLSVPDIRDKICCQVEDHYRCRETPDPVNIVVGGAFTIGKILATKLAIGFLFGFPLLIWLVVHKWRRRHLSMDKSVEEFLQSHHNFAPIKYTHWDIKKMTNNFNHKLGEGGYGIVYKGKLRSGPYVAVKVMDQSMANEEEFINEVGTIGRIHHVNIVQLIGFCVERSMYALVYEFLSNGSLDRYIFIQQSLGFLTLAYDKMFEIALGVARGIGYLHHGCEVQILHFDIKPHNILLDEKFNPKISDFGLARLHPTNESFINLTAARGTMGYMAPEMFYRNFGVISYKADVYSFGMMLMELAGKRKNMDHLVEDMNQIYFPLCVYDQLCAGNDIEIKDTTVEERKLVKRILIVALWCIQMKPSNRPSMNKVIEMLEGDFELLMPPKPFVAPHERVVDDHGITRTYSVDFIN